MRAAVTRPGGIEIDDVAAPELGSGQVLVHPLFAGICGSDLHAADDLARFAELTSRVGGPGSIDPAADLVFGHEFCAEVVAHGPETTAALPVGTRVCSVPMVLGPAGPEAIGYSNAYPGALAELMVLQEMLLLRRRRQRHSRRRHVSARDGGEAGSRRLAPTHRPPLP
jgi:threonine dehydrogenase-like Zn-dependent dehydrogenase